MWQVQMNQHAITVKLRGNILVMVYLLFYLLFPFALHDDKINYIVVQVCKPLGTGKCS